MLATEHLIAETMNQDNLTFAGYPVTLRPVDGDVLVHCKNVIGSFSQAKAFKEKSSMSNTYPFGVKTSEPCEIKENPFSGGIAIACLEGTKQEFDRLYKKCESLLK